MSRVRSWLALRVLALFADRGGSLDRIPVFSRNLTRPLRRAGLDPIVLDRPTAGAGPVRKHGHILGIDVWLVTDYQTNREILNDTRFSTDIRSLVGGATGTSMIGGLGFTDPPEHTHLRKVLIPEFTARQLAALEPAVQRVVDLQLDVLAARGSTADVVADFAFPVPFAVICELLGLQSDEREQLQQLGNTRFDVSGGGHSMFGAISRARVVLREAVAKRRVESVPGLIGSMVAAHGADHDDDTFAGLADGVFTGGYETSAGMLALGVLALLRDPAAWRGLADGSIHVDRVVEELLRYLSVVQIAFPRFAKTDLEVGGQRIRAGDAIVCSLARANRDDVFGARPDEFDPDRPARPHLAFGQGFHRCVGAELARLQLRAAFRGLARRFPDMSLAAAESELEFHDLSIVYGVRALPVHLTPPPATRSTPAATKLTGRCGR